jgi:alpha-D-xyloside xylohydrolase
MKFTDGYWKIKEGINTHFVSCAFETEQQGDELVVYAPEKQIKNRGDTLNMPLLTVRYSSPLRNVIKVRISHFEGTIDREPYFPLETAAEKNFKPLVQITGESAVLENGELSVTVRRIDGWRNIFRAGGKTLTENNNKSTGYMTDNEKTFIKEKIQLNEDSVWSCQYRDRNNPAAVSVVLHGIDIDLAKQLPVLELREKNIKGNCKISVF